MAGTKARAPSQANIVRRIAQGYGQGELASFKPFFYARDVPSMGASTMIAGRTTKRVHHYLSNQELKVHLLAEFSSSIVDIREQYALLPWDETQEDAARLGIRHPTFPRTATPTVLTTDLVLSLARPTGIKLVAISVKFTKDLTARALEKLLLERLYWNRRGIQWILATERNIPATRTHNLAFFAPGLTMPVHSNNGVDVESFNVAFEQSCAPHLSLAQTLLLAERSTGVQPHSGFELLCTAVWHHVSRIDLDAKQIVRHEPLSLRQGDGDVFIK